MFSRRSFDPPKLPQETGNVAQDYQALRNHVGQLQRWVASVLRQLNQPGSITISQGKIDDTNIGADKAATGDFSAIGGNTPGTAAFTTLTTSGNAGVGISSPSARLDVAGAAGGSVLLVRTLPSSLGGTDGQGGVVFKPNFAAGVASIQGTNNQLSAAADLEVNPEGGSTVLGAGLATTATSGFPYIPTCAGTPTGTPTTYSNTIPLVYDRTNNKLYAYNGAWKAVALA